MANQLPRVNPNPVVSEESRIYKVSITNDEEITVTVTNSLSVANQWFNSLPLIHNRHQTDLQVGVAFHGENPSVVTVAMGKTALIVSLVHVMNVEGYETITGKWVSFLEKETTRFVSCGPSNVGIIDCECEDAMALGLLLQQNPTFSDLASKVIRSRIELDPVVANGDWNVWPLSEEQVLFSSVKAFVAYRAAVADHGFKTQLKKFGK